MTTILLGCAGQLGTELRPLLEARGTVIGLDRTTSPDDPDRRVCDLADTHALQRILEQVQPSFIVNAAAYTAVDAAEDEPALAQSLNADMPAQLAQYAAAAKARLVHYSTDYVYAGDANHAYLESAPTDPMSVYGQTKLAGDQAIAESGCDHLIFRTSWVYASHGKNFLLTMLRLAAERRQLQVVDDQIGCPTYAKTLAELSAAAVDRWDQARKTQRQLFHLSSGGQTSWHGFADYLLAQATRLGVVDHKPDVLAVGSDAYPTKARRPAWSVMDNHRFTDTFGLDVPHWQVQVDRCLADLNH